MTKIKTLVVSLLVTCLFFVTLFSATNTNAAVTSVRFTPSEISPQPGTDIQIDLVMEVVGTSATYADVTINIPSEITVKSVTNGGYFDNLLHPEVTNGRLELHGYFNDSFAAKTGIGTLAHLTLTSTKVLGSSNITFQCSSNGNDTGIITGAGQNILVCSSLNQLTLTYPNASAPPSGDNNNNNNNNSNAPTNACGGTCGSNYNCNSGLYCYKGYCRNPDCVSSLTCGACPTPTPVPTKKPALAQKPTVKPTPIVVTLAKTTPYPSPTPLNEEMATATPGGKPQPIQNLASLVVWSGIGLIAVLVILIAIRALRKKGPPQITPPDTYKVDPPMPNSPPPPTGF